MLGWCEDTSNVVPSSKTFQRVLRTKSWKHKLLFRTEAEQATCTVCDDIREARRKTHDPTTRKLLNQQLHDHWAEQQADRMVYRAMRDSSRGGGDVLSLILDGMDQAKFKCPRSTRAYNHFKTCWRPQLHVTGCIIHGVADVYWVGDADLKKDANASVQFLNEALEIAIKEKQKIGLRIPSNLVIQLDNTCRENKNNLILRWAAGLVGASTFSSVSLHFLRKGHTHEDIDQRFKIISTLISKQKLLETPYEFMDCIHNHMTVPPSHRLFVRQMQPPYDYWEHYADASIYTRDVHNHTGPHAAHAFRLIKWQGTDAPPGSYANGDVVLLVKHFMKDARAAQAPIMLIPRDACNRIPKGAPNLTTRRGPATDRELKEYLKTAAKCRQPPWNLHLSALYLERWVNFLKSEPTDDADAHREVMVLEQEGAEEPDPPPPADSPADNDLNFKWLFFRTARTYDHALQEGAPLVPHDEPQRPIEDETLKYLVPAAEFHPIFTSSATAASRAKQNAERRRQPREAKAKPKQVRGNFGKAASKRKAQDAEEAVNSGVTDEDDDAECERAAMD